jgi:hypothetical protein
VATLDLTPWARRQLTDDGAAELAVRLPTTARMTIGRTWNGWTARLYLDGSITPTAESYSHPTPLGAARASLRRAGL